jgi:Uncharacterized protein conserved in bacteria, putative lipoprotein
MNVLSSACRRLPASSIVATVRPTFVAATLLLIGVALPARAEPSFDCNNASTTAEKLICSDAALSRLDKSLADSFQGLRQQRTGPAHDRLVGEQRAWLTARDRTCGIPAGGAEPTLAQRWTWAPCLAEQYRVRLTQLGVSVPPVERPAAANATGFIHPLCLDLATGGRAGEGDDSPIPILLDDCNRGYRHVDVDVGDRGMIGASGAVGGFPTWFSYRPIGRLTNGESVVLVEWSGGGTGQFSEIDSIRSTTDGGETTISARNLLGGGDRCNGGIESASMRGESAIDVVVRATPADIVAAGDPGIDVYGYDLASCAICCAGTIAYRFDVGANKQAVASATVGERLSEQQDAAQDAQACFDRLVATGGNLPRTFDAAALAQLAQRFREGCPSSQR